MLDCSHFHLTAASLCQNHASVLLAKAVQHHGSIGLDVIRSSGTRFRSVSFLNLKELDLPHQLVVGGTGEDESNGWKMRPIAVESPWLSAV